MTFRIALAAVLLLAGVAQAKPPGYFGFGTPPAYLDVMQRVVWYQQRHDVAPWMREYIEVGQPEAGCIDRGFKRDVCGYAVCVRIASAPARRYMLTNGFGTWMHPQQGCPNIYGASRGWQGDPPVQVPDFCAYQPRQKGCRAGETEDRTPLPLEVSTNADQLAQEARDREQMRTALEPVPGYLAMTVHYYSLCRAFADQVFTPDRSATAEDAGFLSACQRHAQSNLQDQVKVALDDLGDAELASEIKDLHAYVLASLRALDNYRQSIIEARQDRSTRMSTIDERVTRITMELP